jgi:DNA invertase Pin-like site-specific DNA recombinase
MKTSAGDVAIYARYSTDRQDARSIEDQVRRCRALAAGQGYRVAGEYADAAISGSHMDRARLQRLLADARRCSFHAVIVDDLSRLSRDLGDTWRIVFEDLGSVGIKVIDASTGLASDSDGARLTFGAMALVNDTFLQLVKKETHRGLEGRAIQGFATGGKCYGYSSVQEENPPDPEHPRRISVIDQREAEVVLRIFQDFVAGRSCQRIAHALNGEGTPAPHDGGKGNKQGRGWGHTTIRAMLLNERYIGRWTWNRHKWVRVPGKGSRRALPRPAAEHVTKEIPTLRIVPPELWERARARFPKRPGRGRAMGGGKMGSTLLTGLLRCGVCGGSFVIVSRRHKNGNSYANFGCTVNRSRGDSICPNSRTVSEKKVTEAVIETLKTQLTAPALLERFVDAFTKAFKQANGGEVSRERKEMEKELAIAESRVKNVTTSLAKIGFSEALAAQLAIEEKRVCEVKARLSQAGARTSKVLPHPRRIETYIRNLLAVLEVDKEAAHALLGRHMPPLVLTPEGTTYRISGGFDLSLCLDDQTAFGPEGDRDGQESTLGRVAGACYSTW